MVGLRSGIDGRRALTTVAKLDRASDAVIGRMPA